MFQERSLSHHVVGKTLSSRALWSSKPRGNLLKKVTYTYLKSQKKSQKVTKKVKKSRKKSKSHEKVKKSRKKSKSHKKVKKSTKKVKCHHKSHRIISVKKLKYSKNSKIRRDQKSSSQIILGCGRSPLYSRSTLISLLCIIIQSSTR